MLLTQCPHCQTSFRVSPSQLQAANGLVRCGSCLGVFSASANEIRIKPETHSEADGVTEAEEFDTALLDEAEEAEQTSSSETLTQDDTTMASSVEAAPTTVERVSIPPSTAAANLEPRAKAATVTQDANEWFLRDERDISLGDLRLDDDEDETGDDISDEPQDDIEEYAEASPSQLSVEANADTDIPDGADEYAGPDIETADAAEPLEADDVLYDRADAADDYDEPLDEVPAPLAPSETPEPVPVRAERPIAPSLRNAIPQEKAALHRRLSNLQDSEALGSVDDDQLEHLEEPPITLAMERGLSHWLGRIMLTLLCMVLLISLPAQWLYAKRNLLADDPYFARLAPSVCAIFTCAERKPAYTPTAIYSQQLLVRSHPEFKDALEVSFVFHNDTESAQRFPDVELAFSNQSGVPLANRLFSPSEYLPEELRTLDAMPPKSTLQAKLELVDPGKDAVNYTLKIHDRRPTE